MNIISKKYEGLVLYFTPKAANLDLEAANRTDGFIRVMILTSIVMMGFVILYISGVKLENRTISVVLGSIMPISCLFLIKHTKQIYVMVNVFSAMVCLITFYEAVTNGGGIYARNLLLLFLGPLFAFLFSGKGSGFFWLTICSLGTVILYFMTLDPEYDLRMKEMAINESFLKESSLSDVLFSILFAGILIYYSNKKTSILIKELKERQNEIEQNNQELEQFAYATSHDLKQPVLTVSNFVNLLESKIEDNNIKDEEINTFFKYIKRANSNMQVLIKDLLSYATSSNSNEEQIQTVDLNTILDQALSNLEHQTKEKDLELNIGTLPTVNCNPIKIQQLLQNLISNSIKFKHEFRPIKIDISAKIDDNFHTISIKDNGQGIPKDQLEKIFLPFKKAYSGSNTPGSGIGLATANRIVEIHHGRLWVESELGQGASFHFTLPK